MYYEQSDWLKKVIPHIYHIIKYSWHGVTQMWPVMWFLQIPKAVTCQSRGVSKSCDFNHIIFILVYAWSATLNYKWIIGCLTLQSTMYQLYFSYFRLWFYGSWIYKYNVPVQSMYITTKRCEFESRWWRGVLDTTLGDTVCQRLLPDWWFSQTWSHNVVSSTSRHERSSNWQLK